MKLTSKGRYAVTAMLDVAIHANTGPVPLADISERQGISLSYLEQLFSRLRKYGLVNSVRGPGGGYVLSRSMDEHDQRFGAVQRTATCCREHPLLVNRQVHAGYFCEARRARLRSPIRSSIDSMPTDRRIRSSLMPAASRSLADIC